jgi:hypothetical protein
MPLLLGERAGAFLRNVTSEEAIGVWRSMLDRIEVDWTAHGFDDAALDGLAEFGLRMIQSLVLDPGRQQTSAQLRAFLTDWVAPAINFHAARPALK